MEWHGGTNLSAFSSTCRSSVISHSQIQARQQEKKESEDKVCVLAALHSLAFCLFLYSHVSRFASCLLSLAQYRDRAAERREGKNADYVEQEKLLVSLQQAAESSAPIFE